LVTSVRDEIDIVVDRIVDGARIASRRRRDELRRELRSHFEESAATADARHDALLRFGDAAGITNSFRKVYARDYVLLYAAKVAACVAAATMVAVLVEAIAGLRIGSNAQAWHLSPGFGHAARFGVVQTLALVAAAEAVGPRFSWSRALTALGCYGAVVGGAVVVNPISLGTFVTAGLLATIGVGVVRITAGWPARVLLTLAAFTAAEYQLHMWRGIGFGPMRAFASSVVLVALWGSTIGIVACGHRAFARAFGTS
jgi:hypothetical protein